MSELNTAIDGSVVAPQGFKAAGVHADIKEVSTGKGSDQGAKRDVALIGSDKPGPIAGVFTTNQIKAAPIQLCLERLGEGSGQAIIANSGNANACTGSEGRGNALRMAELTAEAMGIPQETVFVGSTGRIGVPLPMQRVTSGIRDAVKAVGRRVEHASNAAEAILTSDAFRKQLAVEFECDGRAVRIGGICKGAGMIDPEMTRSGQRGAATPADSTLPGTTLPGTTLPGTTLPGTTPPGTTPPGTTLPQATMLCFVTSDIAIEGSALQTALDRAVGRSFNRITVDGDRSTNDTVLLLANGMAENQRIESLTSGPAQRFQAALDWLLTELAKMIVRDGEGASRFVTVRVRGAATDAEADIAARAIANSELVKTSWCGGDPNWGRILAAVGASRARAAEEVIDIGYSRPGEGSIYYALRAGQVSMPLEALTPITSENEFELHLDLHLGEGEAHLYASDLTEAYVDLNKGE